MIENKQELIDLAREQAKVNQFDNTVMNPSLTKLGPCRQSNGKFSYASWTKPYPIPDHYQTYMSDLGEKFKGIKWLPLALPKFKIDNFDEFREIWEREKIDLVNTNDSVDSTEFYGLYITSGCLIDFNLHDLYNNGVMTTSQFSNNTGYIQGRAPVGAFSKKLYKHKIFFDLISKIMFQFPIYSLSNILIVETKKDVAPHREQSWAWKCPTEFRIMLYDENTQPTIYVSDIETGETRYIDLPDDTNSFCWSNGTQVYGIDYHGKPSYQIIVNAMWHSKKLDSLLTASISKYANNLNYTIEL